MLQPYFCVFLLLGSNQGNKKDFIERAVSAISSECGQIVTASSYYFSESWGYDDEDYLNQALEINTQLSAKKLLQRTQHIEKKLGRETKTTTHYEARPIDIDILFFENYCIETPSLTIPHPRLHLRNFVLQPLQEIAPNFIHPLLHQSISELAENCPDKGTVWKA